MSRRSGRLNLAVYSDAEAPGGAEINLSRVLTALPEHVDVTIIGIDDEVVDWLQSGRPGSRAETLPAVRDRRDLRGLARHHAALRRLDADVLQFNLSSASSCQWPMFVASFLRRPALIAVENSSMGTWSSTSSRLKRFTSGRLAAHIAVGDRMGRIIEESCGLRPGSLETIYHGVPGVGRSSVTRGPEPTLLTVARHDPVKGIDILLEALVSVPAPARLVIIGDGTETERLEEQRRSLDLTDRVEFVSLPWEQRASDVMWAYDGLVLPSRLEGFPVTIIEAMLAGLPVVATDVGSVREAVTPGETGWIVEPENPTALAEAIVDLLSDPGRARRMGEQARAIATERFTIDATVDAYMDLYSRVTGRELTTV